MNAGQVANVTKRSQWKGRRKARYQVVWGGGWQIKSWWGRSNGVQMPVLFALAGAGSAPEAGTDGEMFVQEGQFS